MLSKIKIVSGGQTGADRAALDFAIENKIEYGGWCPKDGWAEDLPTAPGLFKHYANLKETESSQPEERTKLNILDSDATLILSDEQLCSNSKGTELTKETAQRSNKPLLIANINDKNSIKIIRSWIQNLEDLHILNIAGPRESECPGLYDKTLEILNEVF